MPVCRARSDQVAPRRHNLLTHFPGFQSPRPDPPGDDRIRHFGSHFGSPCTPIRVHHPDTSKPPTAFPQFGGPSSVSTQSAPEGIRTPNLLIRSNSIDPTRAEAARPHTKPGRTFAQVTGVKTRQDGPGRVVTEPRSAEFWVTFWVTPLRGRLGWIPRGGRCARAVSAVTPLLSDRLGVATAAVVTTKM